MEQLLRGQAAQTLFAEQSRCADELNESATMPKIPDLHPNPPDKRDYFGRDQFFAWFKVEHPDAKKVSHSTFKRKLTYEAWAACEQYALRSFRRHLGAAVQAGELKDGTAQYAYDLLYAALETPLPPREPMPDPKCKLCLGRGEYRSDLETGLARCGCVPAESLERKRNHR